MKRIRIAQPEGVDWKKALRRYVTKYRSIDHTTTGRSPAEVLFNRKMRGKLPELHADCHLDLETRDRDAEVKVKTKTYADRAANAKPSDIAVGDQVLVRQERKDKFSTPFNPTPYHVVSKTSNSVMVEAPGGTQYSRNASHVKRFMVDDPVSTPSTPSASPDEIVVPITVPSQYSSELTPAALPHHRVNLQPGVHCQNKQVQRMETRQLLPVGTLQLIKQQCLARQQHRDRLRGRRDHPRDIKTMF